ncbi:hypothetical protein [Streptomyces sp. TLI_185]|uniref:hypothetical protein n=1 Tax=Streptomyces sp. TLI_185 TaxID=2485151 RepID=UPI00161662FD|nr:hypothetical protein [Streptomyces sp. TLI_185]
MTTTAPPPPLLSAQGLHVTFPGRHGAPAAGARVGAAMPPPAGPTEDPRSGT